MAASTPTDQTTMMKDILEALKTLQVNQIQLASTVDAISGRVNVLAGMKEIQKVAMPPAAVNVSSQKPESDGNQNDEQSVPESPSIPPTTIDAPGSPSQISSLGHATKAGTGTGRIILT